MYNQPEPKVKFTKSASQVETHPPTVSFLLRLCFGFSFLFAEFAYLFAVKTKVKKIGACFVPKSTNKFINHSHCQIIESNEANSDFDVFGTFYQILENGKKRVKFDQFLYACQTSGTTSSTELKLVRVPTHCLTANLTFMMKRIPPNGHVCPVFGPFYFDSGKKRAFYASLFFFHRIEPLLKF